MLDQYGGRNPIHAVRSNVTGSGGTLTFTWCKLPLGVEQVGLIAEADYRELVGLAHEYPDAYPAGLEGRHLCRECADALGLPLP